MCLAISGVQLNLVWEFSEDECDGEQVQITQLPLKVINFFKLSPISTCNFSSSSLIII